MPRQMTGVDASFMAGSLEHRRLVLKRFELLGVALGSQPVDAAASIQPLINFGLALETLDDSVLDTRKLRQDLPVIVGNSKHLECHSLLCHAILCACSAVKERPRHQGGAEVALPPVRVGGVKRTWPKRIQTSLRVPVASWYRQRSA